MTNATPEPAPPSPSRKNFLKAAAVLCSAAAVVLLYAAVHRDGPLQPSSAPQPSTVKFPALYADGDQGALRFTRGLGTGPMLVEFYADWCPSCQLVSSTMKDVERQWAGRVEFLHVNVDLPVSRALAQRYRVDSIPMFVFLDAAGRDQGTLLGDVDHDTLAAHLARIVKN